MSSWLSGLPTPDVVETGPLTWMSHFFLPFFHAPFHLSMLSSFSHTHKSILWHYNYKETDQRVIRSFCMQLQLMLSPRGCSLLLLLPPTRPRLVCPSSHSSFLWDRAEPQGRGMSVSNQLALSHMLQLVSLSLWEGDWVSEWECM